MCQGIGRPEERQRNDQSVGQSEDTQHLLSLSSVWTWFVGPQNNDKSHINDPWSQVTTTNKIITKTYEILKELPKRGTEKLRKCCLKMVPINLFDTRFM